MQQETDLYLLVPHSPASASPSMVGIRDVTAASAQGFWLNTTQIAPGACTMGETQHMPMGTVQRVMPVVPQGAHHPLLHHPSCAWGPPAFGKDPAGQWSPSAALEHKLRQRCSSAASRAPGKLEGKHEAIQLLLRSIPKAVTWRGSIKVKRI